MAGPLSRQVRSFRGLKALSVLGQRAQVVVTISPKGVEDSGAVSGEKGHGVFSAYPLRRNDTLQQVMLPAGLLMHNITRDFQTTLHQLPDSTNTDAGPVLDLRRHDDRKIIQLHPVDSISANTICYVDPAGGIGIYKPKHIISIGMPEEELLRSILTLQEQKRHNPDLTVTIITGDDWMSMLSSGENDALGVSQHTWGQPFSDLTVGMQGYLKEKNPQKYNGDNLQNVYPTIAEMNEYKKYIRNKIKDLTGTYSWITVIEKNVLSVKDGKILDDKNAIISTVQDPESTIIHMKAVQPRSIPGLTGAFFMSELTTKKFKIALDKFNEKKDAPILIVGSGPTAQWMYSLIREGSGVKDKNVKVIISLPKNWKELNDGSDSIIEYLHKQRINFNAERIKLMIDDYERGLLVFTDDYKEIQNGGAFEYTPISGKENESVITASKGLSFNFSGNESVNLSDGFKNAGVPDYAIKNHNIGKNPHVKLPEHAPPGSMPWYSAYLSQYLKDDPSVFSLYNAESRESITSYSDKIHKDNPLSAHRFPLDVSIFSAKLSENINKTISEETDTDLSHIVSKEEAEKVLMKSYEDYLDSIIPCDLSESVVDGPSPYRGTIDPQKKQMMLSRFKENVVDCTVKKMFPETEISFESVKDPDHSGSKHVV